MLLAENLIGDILSDAAAATIGGDALRATAFTVEHAARIGQIDHARTAFAQLRRDFAALSDAMHRDLQLS
mgnify:CR=1 FL=1